MAAFFADLTFEAILKFVATATASHYINKVLTWVDDKVLGEPKTCEDVLKTMKEYHEELLGEIKQLDWNVALTKEFGSEQTIRNLWSTLILISKIQPGAVKDDKLHDLFRAILDINQGTIHCLLSLHDALTGISSTDPSKRGLLKIIAEILYSKMTKNPKSLPPVKYVQHLHAYLDSVFVLQLMAINLFCLAEESEDVKKLQLQELGERMKQQIGIIERWIPTGFQDVYRRPFQQFIIEDIDSTKVAYGDPPTQSVWFRKRHENNEDEEWVFICKESESLMIRKCGGDDVSTYKHLINADGTMESDDGGEFYVFPRVTETALRSDETEIYIWSLQKGQYLSRNGNKFVVSANPYAFKLKKTNHPDYTYDLKGHKIKRL